MHIDVDPAVLGANYQTEVAAGRRRAGSRLRALRDEVRASCTSRPIGATGRAAWRAPRPRSSRPSAALARSDETPIRPERVVADAAASCCRADAIVVADPGTPCPYFSAYYELREAGRHFITNRAHGALGYSHAGRGRRAVRPAGREDASR